MILESAHAGSGSAITANSRRLRTLLPNSAAFAVAKDDVKADIARYASVSFEDRARCSDDYRARMNVEMRVCACCGLRDPSDQCKVEVGLQDISSEHWLHACRAGRSRAADGLAKHEAAAA